ncbi:MAG: hypothetical protein KDA80_20505 [Planctomycetaceae bacterium]|nr:hypothetical protein [Planctomycetaceae bacterium]
MASQTNHITAMGSESSAAVLEPFFSRFWQRVDAEADVTMNLRGMLCGVRRCPVISLKIDW